MNIRGREQQEALQTLLDRGFAHLARGEIRAAGECCRRVLQVKPDLVQGHFLVGLVALEAKERKTAFSAFGSVTKLDNDHAAAWAHLARLFMTEGQVNRADAALREATRCQSADPMVHDLLGTVSSLMGEYGEAGRWFAQAAERAPRHPPFLLNRANNLIYQGRTGEACDILRRIVAMAPDSPQAHWALAGATRATDSQHVTQMQGLAARPGLHARARAFYLYAIGKELEDLEDWQGAFAAFAEGARARRSTVEYDEQAEAEMFTFLERQFTPTWLAGHAGAGHDTTAPVFVLGQPRTGTTLVERIANAHSQVHSAGELQQFSLAVRRLSNFQDPQRFSAAFFAAAAQLPPAGIGEMYLDTTRRMRGATPRFVDKLPQNYLLLPLILAALPNARIVHLTRDPRDACFSSFKQLFADAYLHSYDLGEMARHHARYRHLMNVWRERFPGRFLDVSYEALVRDFEPNARRLVEYLDLPWENDCLAFHSQASAVSTASAVQVREPAHTRSIGRWRRYEQQLAPMLAALADSGVALPDVE